MFGFHCKYSILQRDMTRSQIQLEPMAACLEPAMLGPDQDLQICDGLLPVHYLGSSPGSGRHLSHS
ncbi:MAG: hypothetical protein CTY20_09765 [Hyphomicrobium sp.]|nr:MAG: hypothetical protein CTY20_09765 [Hyphomicrobium sp.]